MSKTFRDYNPDQQFLFPPSLNDFVPEGHLSHFVRNLVQAELDLSAIELEYSESRGKPPFNPRMMVAVFLYGFSQGVYSSRKLAKACQERVDFMAVSGMNKPHFRTLLDFRKRHLEALGGLFLQVLVLCKKADMAKLGHVALDGTKLKGNASKDKNKKYENITKEEGILSQQVQAWFDQAQADDQEEDEEFGIDNTGDELPEWVKDKVTRTKKLREAKKALEEEAKERKEARSKAEASGEKPREHSKKIEGVSPRSSYNFTDSESKLMKTRNGFIQGYNGQLAVDQSSYVIVSCHVSQISGDTDELKPALNQIENNLGQLPKELSADSAYNSAENLHFLEKKNVKGYIALEERNWTAAVTLRMKKRLRQGGKQSRYRLRKQTVEPIFGIIKTARGFGQFLLRGLENVQQEWKLVCTAHNMLKLYAERTK